MRRLARDLFSTEVSRASKTATGIRSRTSLPITAKYGDSRTSHRLKKTLYNRPSRRDYR